MTLLIETVQEGVAVLTMNRPEQRNAFSEEMAEALLNSLERVALDPQIGCVILTGAGAAFSAGGDVVAMAAAVKRAQDISIDRASTSLRRFMECSRLLHDMPKPTIAALPGAAAGAGLSMALACDLRIAAAGAKIVTAFARIGLSGDFGGTYFLSRLVGTAKARELYYFSETLLAEEAISLGVVNKVVRGDALMDSAMTWARQLADGPRVALAAMKRNFNLAEQGRLDFVLDQEALLHTQCVRTADHAEAAAAFVESRAPRFVGA
ncbi:enoyl-CoA hydratase-related protein [Sphingopyxis sp.]|uniref:enoyl-CoA hydratase-related protein n=1 Tax=Sphingopyxis sp. TaxID=1908224 RepID=UPI003D6D26FD